MTPPRLRSTFSSQTSATKIVYAKGLLVFSLVGRMVLQPQSKERAVTADPPPLKWSDLRYVFDIKEDSNGKEAIQA